MPQSLFLFLVFFVRVSFVLPFWCSVQADVPPTDSAPLPYLVLLSSLLHWARSQRSGVARPLLFFVAAQRLLLTVSVDVLDVHPRLIILRVPSLVLFLLVQTYVL